MHFHHRHDIAGCVDEHDDWPDVARTILATLDRMEIRIMTATQDALDALAAQQVTAAADITAAVGALQTEIANLHGSQGEPAPDLSGVTAAFQQVQAAIGSLQALVVPPAPPVVAPADVPVAPADVPADPNAPAASIPSVPLA